MQQQEDDKKSTNDTHLTHHYWIDASGLPENSSSVKLTLPDLHLELATARGVFAARQIDRGTRYLLSSKPQTNRPQKDLLDLGCGYGPIALTLAIRNPTSRIWAIDTNPRALDLCRDNARSADLKNIIVAAPEEVPPSIDFGQCWSNPPIHIGKKALHDLLAKWLNRLLPTGSAHLVVQRHLGSDSLARWLNEQGWVTTRRSSRRGYRLLDVSARKEIR